MKQTLREQLTESQRGHAITAARADASDNDVRCLKAELAAVQQKLERAKGFEPRYDILRAEHRMVKSELQRVWAFIRKERGPEIGVDSDCPF